MDLAHFALPKLPQVKQPLLPPKNIGAPRRFLRIVAVRQFKASGFFEILSTVLAITHARTIPAIDEDPVDTIAGHDLPLHLRHKIEVVRAESASNPHFRRSPM